MIDKVKQYLDSSVNSIGVPVLKELVNAILCPDQPALLVFSGQRNTKTSLYSPQSSAMQPVPGGLCRNILSCSGKRVSSCLNSKKSLIRLTSLPLATPAMTIRNITVPLIPIHSPADNALVDPKSSATCLRVIPPSSVPMPL